MYAITKQLYNLGLYEFRQTLIHQQSFLSYKAVYQLMKSNENWCAIPRKVSNQVWKQVTGSWSSWLKGLKNYKQSPSDFMGRPKMPNYNTSLNSVVCEKGALDPLPTYRKGGKKQCLSGRRIKRGLYKTLSGFLINADINGALNTIRKVTKDSLDDLVEDTQFIHHCATPRFI